MTCKRSEQCDHADLCRFAKNTDYNLLGGSCFTPKDPQTNEEWLRTATTEQLAEFLADVCYGLLDDVWGNDGDTSCNYRETEKNYWVEWLKQPHTTKE